MPGPQFFHRAKPILFRGAFRTAPALPKPISEHGDFPLVAFAGGSVMNMPGRVSLMLILGVQVSLIGVLQGLSGAFMSRQVIFLSVMLGAGKMGMCGVAMVLGSYLL